MFNQVGWGEIVVLLLVGLFVFGPERLPKVAKDAGRMLRELRRMANAARDDIRGELGPEFADLDVRSLNPRAFVQKHLFDEDDEDDPLIPPYLTKRTPLDRNPLGLPDARSFLAGEPVTGRNRATSPAPSLSKTVPTGSVPTGSVPTGSVPTGSGPNGSGPTLPAQAAADPVIPFDSDAT
ncbi:MAG: sec-independent translocase [Frankia sp.]